MIDLRGEGEREREEASVGRGRVMVFAAEAWQRDNRDREGEEN